MLLVVLQNAYRNGGVYISREEWLERLWVSHTGRRLREMLPDGCEPYVINASPQIGTHSGAVYPPDLAHIQAAIDRVRPDTILACGKLAQAGLDQLGVSYIAAPHPAWRRLSKARTAAIREKLNGTRRTS